MSQILVLLAAGPTGYTVVALEASNAAIIWRHTKQWRLGRESVLSQPSRFAWLELKMKLVTFGSTRNDAQPSTKLKI